ncbi:hypothetical protein M8C21_027242 [Ambrosia artemisiifolia]|uniref:Uncharacterized protein n=1 Tax=Ambrosia artemisiifolia TaxID=4212 RepID=A0AAD5C7W6_AMBAR|nr:hypothetical protein M8C21_027242 [Ambrosia artemisiifolia]
MLLGITGFVLAIEILHCINLTLFTSYIMVLKTFITTSRCNARVRVNLLIIIIN